MNQHLPIDEPVKEEPDGFYNRINKIYNFFIRTHRSAFLFCVSSLTPLIMEVNRILVEKLSGENFVLKPFAFNTPTEIFTQLESALKDCSGLVITNLDEMIILHGETILYNINFSREDIISLDKPILFWLSQEHLSLFANKAVDFFARRDRGVIIFPPLDGKHLHTKHDAFYEEGFNKTEEYKSRSIKIEILEKQLQEAQDRGISKERIAKEIVVDLIEQYRISDLNIEGKELLDRYKDGIDLEKNVKVMVIVGDLYLNLGLYDEAIALFNKTLPFIQAESSQMAYNYNVLGIIYNNKGEWDKALEYYHKSEQIRKAVGDKGGLGSSYNNIGNIYDNKGEWDKALEYYFKDEQICKEVGDKAGLGASYNNIGGIYDNKGEWDKALEYYFKSEQIRKEVGDKAGLGISYNNIGNIYSNKGEWDKALEYYFKSEQIRKEVGDKAGLGSSNLNLALLFYQQNNRQAVTRIDEAVKIFKELGSSHMLKKSLELQKIIYQHFNIKTPPDNLLTRLKKKKRKKK